MLNQLRTYGILVCADFELCRHGAIARLQTCGQKNSSMWWSSCTFVLTMVILGRGFSFQRTFFKNISWIHPQQLMTRLSSRTQGATQAQLYVLCALYGAFDAIWETYCYWLMGVLTNKQYSHVSLILRLLQSNTKCRCSICRASQCKENNNSDCFSSTGTCWFSVSCVQSLLHVQCRKPCKLTDTPKDVKDVTTQKLDAMTSITAA